MTGYNFEKKMSRHHRYKVFELGRLLATFCKELSNYKENTSNMKQKIDKDK